MLCGSIILTPFGHRPTTEELNRKKLTYEDGIAMRALQHVITVDPELILPELSNRTGPCFSQARHPQDREHHPPGRHGRPCTRCRRSISWKAACGRESEEQHRDNVMILGHDAAADLFPGEDPIGKDVECEGDVFTVIGVLDLQPQPFGSGRNTAGQPGLLPVGDVPQNSSRKLRTSGLW